MSQLTPQTVAAFNRLNCANKNWQVQIYGSNPNGWGREQQQAVGCQKVGRVWYKYAMDKPVILGTDLTAVSAQVNPNGAGYIVSFNVKTGPAANLGRLTETMFTYNATVNSQPTGASDFSGTARRRPGRQYPVVAPGPGSDHHQR